MRVKAFGTTPSIAAMCLVLAGCGAPGSDEAEQDTAGASEDAAQPAPAETVPESSKTADAEAGKPEPLETIQVDCAADEPTIFSCKVKGGKQLSVCGSENVAGEPMAQYRFGGTSAEMVIDGGKFSSVGYSGGGEAQIAFRNGQTKYIVFSRTVRTNFEAGEPNEPDFQDGVMVVRPGKPVATISCVGEVSDTVDLGNAEQYGGVGDDVFYPDE